MDNVTDTKTNSNLPNRNQPKIISAQELALLKRIRSVAGITAEYLMSFLDRFPSKTEQMLIYSMCCNFDRLKHTIELQLFDHGVYLADTPYDPKAFSNVTYVEPKLVDAIQTFLNEQKEQKHQQQQNVTKKLFLN